LVNALPDLDPVVYLYADPDLDTDPKINLHCSRESKIMINADPGH